MKKILFTILSFTSVVCFAQQNDVLFTIDDATVTVAEFKKMYEKNLDFIEDENAKNIDSYLDLYINYKLKIKEAYTLKLDTSKSFKREFSTYKNQLTAPYLQDDSLVEELAKEAYFRTKNEIKASHILIQFPKKTLAKDTLQYYNKITAVYNRIKNGESFEEVAYQVSEDPSAKINRGNLGYFSAFRMVSSFEDMAYKTKIGEVSKPFKTRFGYHIVKPTDMRASKGEFEVARILINDKSIVGKSKMDSVYAKLQSGRKFEELAKEFSTDRVSAEKGGKLPRFGTGRMVEEFDNQVLFLNNIGDYSKPFKTRFGWHIVKLLKKYPVLSFDKMKNQLIKKVKSGGKIGSVNTKLVEKLKKEYTISIDKEAFALFKNSDKRVFEKEKMQTVLVAINAKKFTQESFSNFSRYRTELSIDKTLDAFINTEIINYYKENLIHTEPVYKSTLQEYKEGLLLFDLMQQKVWNKASKDTLGLQKFFDETKKFKNKNIDEIKGEVINDYQAYLDKNWVDNLRKKAVLKINEKALVKFKENYK